ncbi:hypothetical protein [Dyella sp. C11]|uniref:hypothetical protein n=1 Tax=Dyella sp. C11 TaxID=2126991 RepID=UPI000D6468C3|nr:hypothetical protein [Dyella sp. C11]
MTHQEVAGIWASTGLCAFSVAIAVLYNSGTGIGAWTGPLIYLPMCFAFVSLVLYRQSAAIHELKQEIKRLRDGGNQGSTG